MTEEPPDRYLWDLSGEPDEQLRGLESLLVRYRFERPLTAALDEVDGDGDGDLGQAD